MCGIAGKLSFKGPLSPGDELKKMASALQHRGPDAEGIITTGPAALINRRLAVIDLSKKGNQPMSNGDQSVWITFNGEIYNFETLRQDLEKTGQRFVSRTDTEVVLRLYERHDVECLKYLRGMFAFAIWDGKQQRLFLARDRIGKKPLKYYLGREELIFASELKAILKHPSVTAQPDFEAIHHYLTYQYVPAPMTGFVDIKKLPPAHYLLAWADGRVEMRRYWELDFSRKLDLPIDEWQKAILEKFEESVRIRLRSDVPLGAFLSGGIDSSMVVAVMTALLGNGPVKTFSIGFSDKRYNELPHAGKIAQLFKTEHKEFIVEPEAIGVLPELFRSFEEPYADSSALPVWHLSKMTREYVTVALTGDGGDENFAGYLRYPHFKLASLLIKLPKAVRDLARIFRHEHLTLFLNSMRNRSPEAAYLDYLCYFTDQEKELLYGENFQRKRAGFALPDSSEILAKGFEEASEKNIHQWLDRLLFFDFHTYLPDDLMVKTDLASMAHSLETRCPFLDHEFMELCAGIPPQLKMKGFTLKYIFKKAAEKYLPRQIIRRKKKGFAVPIDRWFRHELAPYANTLLCGPHSFAAAYFNKSYIEKMLADHQAGRRNFSRHLWVLLALEHWWQSYFTEGME